MMPETWNKQIQSVNNDGIFGLARGMRWSLFCVKGELQWIAEISCVPTVDRLGMFIFVSLRPLIGRSTFE